MPVGPGGQDELVGAAGAAHHSAAPLAVVAPDQEPAEDTAALLSCHHITHHTYITDHITMQVTLSHHTHPNSIWQLMQAFTVLLGSITGANSLHADLPDLSSSLVVL